MRQYDKCRDICLVAQTGADLNTIVVRHYASDVREVLDTSVHTIACCLTAAFAVEVIIFEKTQNSVWGRR